LKEDIGYFESMFSHLQNSRSHPVVLRTVLENELTPSALARQAGARQD